MKNLFGVFKFKFKKKNVEKDPGQNQFQMCFLISVTHELPHVSQDFI